MGNTTIIELDHDLASEIRNNPEEFVQEILSQLSCFYYSSYQYTKDGHPFIDDRILGGRVIAGFHRSGFIYETWLKCKAMIAEVTRGRNNH